MCKTLYNACLEERISAWRHHRRSVTYRMQQDQLPGIRNDHPEWKGLDSQDNQGSVASV